MSEVAEAAPADVQPGQGPDTGTTEGQGSSGGQGSVPTDLSHVPEEARPYVEAELKKVEGLSTRKFQEHAEQAKAWSALEETGIQNLPPNVVGEMVQFVEMMQDGEQFDDWIRAAAEARGLDLSGRADDAEESEEEEDPWADDPLVQRFSSMLDERVGPIEEERKTAAFNETVAEERDRISGEMDELEEEHGKFDRDRVMRLAAYYAEADPENAVKRGFEDYLAIRGDGQAELVNDTLDDPEPALVGGQPASVVKEPETFDEAAAAHRDRLRGGH